MEDGSLDSPIGVDTQQPLWYRVHPPTSRFSNILATPLTWRTQLLLIYFCSHRSTFKLSITGFILYFFSLFGTVLCGPFWGGCARVRIRESESDHLALTTALASKVTSISFVPRCGVCYELCCLHVVLRFAATQLADEPFLLTREWTL